MLLKMLKEKDSNIFSDALKHVIGDKIISNEVTSIGADDDEDIYDGKNLEKEYGDVLPLIKKCRIS